MTRWRLIFCCTLVLVAAGVVALWQSGPQEPVYQGRKLGKWLGALDYSGLPPDLAAREAIQHMGTDVLPHLESQLHAQDSPFKLRMVKLLRKQSLITVHFIPAERRRMNAAAACRALGPKASEYVPQLTALMNSTNYGAAWSGMTALLDVKGRTNCVPEMIMGLTNSPSHVRWFCAAVLGEMWNYAEAAIPALVNSLDDPDPAVPEYAMSALVKFRTQSAIVVPALMHCLDSTNAATRIRAAMHLGRFGAGALPARAKLMELLQHPDPELQRAAAGAVISLSRFDPSALPRAAAP